MIMLFLFFSFAIYENRFFLFYIEIVDSKQRHYDDNDIVLYSRGGVYEAKKEKKLSNNIQSADNLLI